MKYFSYDPEGDGFTLHATAEEAQKHAENDLACHRDNASEGWSDSVEHVCWGEVKQTTFKVREMTKEDAEHAGIYVNIDFDYICDYELKDLPVAINHVDQLADALQNLLDAVGKQPGGLPVDGFLAVDAGLLALHNYRGGE